MSACEEDLRPVGRNLDRADLSHGHHPLRRPGRGCRLRLRPARRGPDGGQDQDGDRNGTINPRHIFLSVYRVRVKSASSVKLTILGSRKKRENLRLEVPTRRMNGFPESCGGSGCPAFLAVCRQTGHGSRQLFGSMPIRSFTADRMRCLQPRYRSVVWIETWPSRNWICSSSPPAEWHSRAQVPLRSCGASAFMPAFFANSRTMCQTAFAVMASPQILPILFTRRNSLPEVTPAAHSHSSRTPFIQSGIGTVRM